MFGNVGGGENRTLVLSKFQINAYMLSVLNLRINLSARHAILG